MEYTKEIIAPITNALRVKIVAIAIAGMGQVQQSFKAWMKAGTSPAALHATRNRAHDGAGEA